MTDDEIKTDAERNLVRYARNEREIDCLLGRLSNASRSFSTFVEAAAKGRAEHERSLALEALADYDLQEDIGRLGADLMEREMLEKSLESHGYAHMIRRRIRPE